MKVSYAAITDSLYFDRSDTPAADSDEVAEGVVLDFAEPDALVDRCVETGPTSFGAYVPDLSGCIAAGESREEALQLIEEAIEFHIEGRLTESKAEKGQTPMALH